MSDRTSESWTSLELRIRKLISGLLEPSLSMLHQTELAQTSLSKLQREIKDRMNTVEGKIEMVNSRIPSVDPINRRVAEQYLRISTVETDSKYQIESLKNQIDSISSSLGSVSSQLYLLNKQTDLYKNHMMEYASNYNTLKRYVEDKVTEAKAEVKQPFEKQAEVNIYVESQIKQVLKSFEAISKDVAYIEFLSKKNEMDLKAGLTLFESKTLVWDEMSSKMHEQMNSLRKSVTSNEIFMKNELEQSQKKIKAENEEMAEELMKKLEKSFSKMMEFVLIEPRYKKKIEELKVVMNLTSNETTPLVPKAAKRGRKNSKTSSRSSGCKENIENLPNKFEFPSDQLLNNAEKSSNSDLKLALEDLQQDLEELKQQFLLFSESTQHSIAVQQQKSFHSKILTVGIKHSLELQLTKQTSCLESSMKDYIHSYISPIKQEILSTLSAEEEKRNNQIMKIQQNSSELETLLKQSSFEFSNFVSNRKRENNDVKLDLKRLYSRLEVLSKDQHKTHEFTLKVQKSVTMLRDLLSLQVCSQKKEERKEEERPRPSKLMIVQEKPVRLEIAERQESILEALNSHLEASSAVHYSSYSQRSLTPELPTLRRNK